MTKWILIIIIAGALALVSGCADTADAEASPTTTPTETQEETKTNASGDVIWIAIVTIWRPTISRTIDKEFTSEVNCWNYYESGVGESKFGTQHLDHQGKNPGKGHHFGPDHLEYPIRTYNGTGETGQIWLTCDIKGRYKGL